METGIHLVVLAQPGRWRDSLVALLKTLHPAGLFPVDYEELLDGSALGRLSNLIGPAPIVLLDLAGLGPAGAQLMSLARRQWPGARTLAFVETLRLVGGPAQGADCILHRSVAAGDLLAAVQRLSGRAGAQASEVPRFAYSYPSPANPHR